MFVSCWKTNFLSIYSHLRAFYSAYDIVITMSFGCL